jgi:uncharacterized protein YwqG
LLDATRVSLEDLPIGASRIGGVPDLPDGFSWPSWSGSRTAFIPPGLATRREEFHDKELHFIAQLNLQDIHGFSACDKLPPQGTLYFFYDCDVQPWGFTPADQQGARVVFAESHAQPLNRWANAKDESDLQSFPCKLSFREDWTLPAGENLGLDYRHDADLLEEVETLKQELLGPADGSDFQPIHRVLGWPEPVQGDMQLECQLVANGIYCGDAVVDSRAESLAAGARDWQLLLQIDTDEENPGWMWGDCGRIYYWIHKDDLARRRFENARLVLQCS